MEFPLIDSQAAGKTDGRVKMPFRVAGTARLQGVLRFAQDDKALIEENVFLYAPSALRIFAQVTSSVSGNTRVSPTTDTKFESATHRGSTCI